jgi:hypothetical protein
MGVSITNDLLREPKPLEYVFQIQLGDASASDGCEAG